MAFYCNGGDMVIATWAIIVMILCYTVTFRFLNLLFFPQYCTICHADNAGSESRPPSPRVESNPSLEPPTLEKSKSNSKSHEMSRSDTKGRVHGTSKSGRKLLPFFKVTASIVFILFTIGVTACVIAWTSECINNSEPVALNLLFGGCYAIALFMLVFIFIKRLDVILGTAPKYNISKQTFNILWIMGAIMVIFGIAALAIYYFSRITSLICFGICVLMYIILSITLLTLFLRNLNKVELIITLVNIL